MRRQTAFPEHGCAFQKKSSAQIRKFGTAAGGGEFSPVGKGFQNASCQFQILLAEKKAGCEFVESPACGSRAVFVELQKRRGKMQQTGIRRIDERGFQIVAVLFETEKFGTEHGSCAPDWSGGGVPVGPVPAAAVAFALGLAAPWFYFAGKVRKRAQLFEGSILDLALGLTSGLRAGQALPQALEVFSRRCEGPLKEELMIVIREYRLGLELAEALQRMYNRIPCEDLQLLIISIRLTTQSGGSMAEVLEKITRMIRGRTEFNQKLRALTAQGRFEALAMSLAPLVAFLLLFFINNDLMLPMVQTAIGWCAIGVMLALEVIGYLVIRAIVDIKV